MDTHCTRSIDEASQSDVTALAALYFGREHVVVGDKEQVTPDAVGQRLDPVQRLIDTNLQGIPNSHLYDGQTSIYDLLKRYSAESSPCASISVAFRKSSSSATKSPTTSPFVRCASQCPPRCDRH